MSDIDDDYPLDAEFVNDTVYTSPLVFSFFDLEDLFNGEMDIDYLRTEPSAMGGIRSSDMTNNIKVAIRIPEYRDRPLNVGTKAYHVGEAEGGYARTVYVAQFPSDFPVRAGLTVHDSRGSWSSCPPHSFEANSLLSPARLPEFDEMFIYFTDPPNGWGVQTFSTTKIAMPFRDQDICHIPLSAHPVVAGPGYRLAYVWCYWGKNIQAMEKFGEHGRI
jgi:5-deoxy-D-glucuronate isomerase